MKEQNHSHIWRCLFCSIFRSTRSRRIILLLKVLHTDILNYLHFKYHRGASIEAWFYSWEGAFKSIYIWVLVKVGFARIALLRRWFVARTGIVTKRSSIRFFSLFVNFSIIHLRRSSASDRQCCCRRRGVHGHGPSCVWKVGSSSKDRSTRREGKQCISRWRCDWFFGIRHLVTYPLPTT